MTEAGVEDDVESKPRSASEDVVMDDVDKSEAHVGSGLGPDPSSIVNLILTEGPISDRQYLAQQTWIAIGETLSRREANQEDMVRAMIARFDGFSQTG